MISLFGILILMKTRDILILGAGVSGLSSGILLLKKGYHVEIWAKDLPPNTTSNKAAAVWYPYLCYPKEKALPWAKATFSYLQKEFLSDPKSGCIEKEIIKICDTPQIDPWWKDAIPTKIERPTQEDLPKGYVDGYKFKTIVLDTTIYMDYLVSLFKKLGGNLIQREITIIQEALDAYDIVVNCTGLGSRELFNDETVYPVRGQMVKIKPNGVTQARFDDDGPNSLTIAIPRVDDIMLGGTHQENDWNVEVDPQDTKDILKRVALLWPEFTDVEIISESVGLRPARESIRLEKEVYGKKIVIHNYGHGGSGFTLSWGCAQDVVSIVENLY